MSAVDSNLTKAQEKLVIEQAEKAVGDLRLVRDSVGRIIFGQDNVVENSLVALLSGGHALLVGLPGLAKTKLVETLGTVLGIARSAYPVHPRSDAFGHSGFGNSPPE